MGPDARYLHYGTPPGPGECAACFDVCGGPLFLPSYQMQPPGFGPPDKITTNLCSYHGSYPPGQFYGDSSQDEGGVGTFRFLPAIQCQDEGGHAGYPVFEASFPLRCT